MPATTARFYSRLGAGQVRCELCPRFCRLKPGQRGFCFVRENQAGRLVLSTYGRSSGFCVDPIEKKPLNHYLPGSAVLSFGTAGCNLACSFCQNWTISRSRSTETVSVKAPPELIARAAVGLGAESVACTYNDPVVFHEYAVDTARECRRLGVRAIAVTAGQVTKAARQDFYRYMDAANVDLKAFSSNFYRRHCSADLSTVLDTLWHIRHETDVWLEITTLIIPTLNDSTNELERMSAWIVDQLGADVPVHFTAFHPDWKLLSLKRTPPATLVRSREIALKNGIRYAYTGNLRDPVGNSTWCHACGQRLIKREGYRITDWQLVDGGRCSNCRVPCSGRFRSRPSSEPVRPTLVSLEPFR